METDRLRPKAVQDLQAIGNFIANDNPARAASFIDELLVLCMRISGRIDAFQRRNDLADGLRQAIHGHYLLLSTPGKYGVVIERIIHGASRLEDLI